MARYVFMTGGVVSSLGKGLATAALGALLQARGYKVRLRKLDPYLNVDPGTMSPFEHGEVFVTEDGAETDLDLGHYERFTGVAATEADNITTGRIYSNVIQRERRGDYLGATIQVIPHITDEIKAFLRTDPGGADFVICEIGGTVGDIEGLPFIEAIRQFANDIGFGQCLFIHMTLVPFVSAAGELKTKPTQHSVKELLSVGIQPAIVMCRSEVEIPLSERKKIALFCNIREDRAIPALDVRSIYEVPLSYHQEGLDEQVLAYFGMKAPEPDLSAWERIKAIQAAPEGEVTIAIVGKYTSHQDAYKSLDEALVHGGIAHKVTVNRRWVDADSLLGAGGPVAALEGADAILVPGGFGARGAEGKMAAARFARERRVPYFGICYGMQLAIIEFAREVAGLDGVNSAEIDPAAEPLVGLMTDWTAPDGTVHQRVAGGDLGGTMRLGAYSCALKEGTLIREIYAQPEISERHRHRFEVNMDYAETLAAKGLVISGTSPDGTLPETMELVDHPWFIGVQFHPELKSKPFDPHPLFRDFIRAALNQARLV